MSGHEKKAQAPQQSNSLLPGLMKTSQKERASVGTSPKLFLGTCQLAHNCVIFLLAQSKAWTAVACLLHRVSSGEACRVERRASPTTYHHAAGHSLQLRGFQPHTLGNPQRRPPFWSWQGAVCQDVVARDKVQLDSSRVVLQCQEPLPHDGVFLQREAER